MDFLFNHRALRKDEMTTKSPGLRNKPFFLTEKHYSREIALYRLLYTRLGDEFPMSDSQRLIALHEYISILWLKKHAC